MACSTSSKTCSSEGKMALISEIFLRGSGTGPRNTQWRVESQPRAAGRASAGCGLRVAGVKPGVQRAVVSTIKLTCCKWGTWAAAPGLGHLQGITHVGEIVTLYLLSLKKKKIRAVKLAKEMAASLEVGLNMLFGQVSECS